MPRHRRSSSTVPVLSDPVLIVLIPVVGFIFLFFAVPPVLSFASNIFRPIGAVKRSWDALNIFLVLFAILCGVFARRNDDTTDRDTNKRQVVEGSNGNTDRIVRRVAEGSSESDSVNPQQWFGYSENAPGGRTPGYSGRLRRSSSSYPDLRQESQWENHDDGDRRFQFRFSDDIEINKSRETTSFIRRPRSKTHAHVEAKAIPIGPSVFLRTPTASPTPAKETPPPPPPPPPPHKSERTYQNVERKEKKVKKLDQYSETVPSSPPPPPPPPPPKPELKKLERRKSNVKREIATALASLYNQKKKRKKSQKVNSQLSPPSELQQHQSRAAPPPPSPPPLPPPPSSVFHNLFKKGTGKSKRVHSAPPPKPSIPCYYDDNASCSGGQSPLIPIPPPPPPPFKLSEWRFDVRGDYVRIQSAQSSRCESPESDDAYSLPSAKGESEKVKVMDGGDGVRNGPAFCPTPDVNLKADTFIARLYDEWRLEKINSQREKLKM